MNQSFEIDLETRVTATAVVEETTLRIDTNVSDGEVQSIRIGRGGIGEGLAAARNSDLSAVWASTKRIDFDLVTAPDIGIVITTIGPGIEIVANGCRIADSRKDQHRQNCIAQFQAPDYPGIARRMLAVNRLGTKHLLALKFRRDKRINPYAYQGPASDSAARLRAAARTVICITFLDSRQASPVRYATSDKPLQERRPISPDLGMRRRACGRS